MATAEVRRTEELLREARGTDNHKELMAIMDEMVDIARLASECGDKEKNLAFAINAFAEWQYGGYGERDPNTLRVVGQQLWSEVSDSVYSINGNRPPSPSFGAEEHEA
jgi:hypothetical protein